MFVFDVEYLSYHIPYHQTARCPVDHVELFGGGVGGYNIDLKKGTETWNPGTEERVQRFPWLFLLPLDFTYIQAFSPFRIRPLSRPPNGSMSASLRLLEMRHLRFMADFTARYSSLIRQTRMLYTRPLRRW